MSNALSTSFGVTPFAQTSTIATTGWDEPLAYNTGDLLVMCAYAGVLITAAAVHPLTPSGWTALSPAGAQLGVFYKTAAANEPSSYTVTFSDACVGTVIVAAYPPATVVSSQFSVSAGGVVSYTPAFPSGVTSANLTLLFSGSCDYNPSGVVGATGFYSSIHSEVLPASWTTVIPPIGQTSVYSETYRYQSHCVGLCEYQGVTGNPVITSPQTSTFSAGFVVLSIPVPSSALTITAIAGGTANGVAGSVARLDFPSLGMALTVEVITGAQSAAQIQAGGAASSNSSGFNLGSTPAVLAITPHGSGSRISGAMIMDNSHLTSAKTVFTSAATTTFSQNYCDTYYGQNYGTFHSSSPPAPGSPVSYGATGPGGSGTNYTLMVTMAEAEILASSTLAVQATETALAPAPWKITGNSVSQTVVFSSPPPNGSLLVATIVCNARYAYEQGFEGVGKGPETMTLTDSSGLTWIPLAQSQVAGYDYAGVWIAQVSGGITGSSLTAGLAAGTASAPAPRLSGVIPSAPAGLTVTGFTVSSVSLSWIPPQQSVTGYHVYQNGVQVRTVTGTSVTIVGLAAASTYVFTVTAYSSAGESSASDPAGVTTYSVYQYPAGGGGAMAYDSLVVAELFELMGGPAAVPNGLPELVNAAGVGTTFRLLSPSGGGSAASASLTWDLGMAQPTTDIVQSLLIDGERPFGQRSSNRTITLPILIRSPDYVTLTAAQELLMQAIDAQTWTLAWTPGNTGLTQVYDCFRALPTVYSYGFQPGQKQPIAVISLNFQALPYGRSDPSGLQSVAFGSPILGGVSAPPAAVVIDNFTSVSGPGWTQSAQFVVGPHSARYTQPTRLSNALATYAKSGLSLNISGLTALSVWVGLSYDIANWPAWGPYQANVTLRWTLTDNNGHKLTFHATHNKTAWANTVAVPKWTRISAAIPQGSGVFNYSNLTAYSVSVSNNISPVSTTADGGSFVRMSGWLDHIVANPPSLASPASLRGVTYNIMSVIGTARTPFSAQFQLPQAGVITQALTGAGLWWPPVGVIAVKAECVGAGGSGGARTSAGVGGGGGGGEYAAEPALIVVPGTPVPYACGTGGQSGAAQEVVVFDQSGTGSWTAPAGVTTIKAECYGGGANGSPGGGGGGGGEYAAEPSLAVTPGKTYQFTVGQGGTLVPSLNYTLGNGTATVFPGDAVTVTAHGGLIATSGGTLGGPGGTGSVNLAHNDGGAGGSSPSSGGGGGGASGWDVEPGNAGGSGSGATGGTGAVGWPDDTGAIVGGGGDGASSPGWPANGQEPGGGGGGGYTDTVNGGHNPGAPGAQGEIVLTYTVASGNPVGGGTTTFGSAGTTGTIVLAHGGASAALNTAAGATGGNGSANSTHYNGGDGFTGITTGGGGGGSGGSLGAGTAATGQSGAPAVQGGGKGADGSGIIDIAGQSASPPGGGGGGANASGSLEISGGNGGNGAITVSYQPPLAPFSTLIAHRPGKGAPPSLNPCVPILNTADLPVGNAYRIPSLVPGQNALFNGTYTVVITVYNWNSSTISSTRQVIVTVTQYEYQGGHGYQTAVNRNFTPSTDITNGIVIMGEMTLPVKDIDPSNTSAYFTVSVSDSDQGDQFLDVLFLDTQGQTVTINVPGGNSYTNFYIDEPTAERDLGYILGSDLDRSQAVSVMDTAVVSGGPFYLSSGDNLFLCYSAQGAPSLGVNYLPRWYLSRLV